MPWEDRVSTGILSRDDVQQAQKGYSGKGAGKDRPAMEASVNIGPIPAGSYAMARRFLTRSRVPRS